MLAQFPHEYPPEIWALLSLKSLLSTRTVCFNVCDRISVQFLNGSVFFCNDSVSYSREGLQLVPSLPASTFELRKERLRLCSRQLLTKILFSWESCACHCLMMVYVGPRWWQLCCHKWAMPGQAGSAPEPTVRPSPRGTHSGPWEKSGWPACRADISAQCLRVQYIWWPVVIWSTSGWTFPKPISWNDLHSSEMIQAEALDACLFRVLNIWCLFWAGKDWSYLRIGCVLNAAWGVWESNS